jgi:hypothetical protein
MVELLSELTAPVIRLTMDIEQQSAASSQNCAQPDRKG